MAEFDVPPRLAESAEREGWQEWVGRLPEIVRGLEARWSVRAGPPFRPGGVTAWVAPVGPDRVLKVGRRHWEADHEADGLRLWDGGGAVRLHAAAELPDTVALLIERCRPGEELTGRPEREQDEVVAGLLRRLWRAPLDGTPIRTLATMCDAWAGELESKVAAGRVPHLDAGLRREGAELFRSLPSTADRQVLLCTDLHAGNVLAAEREPWLAIDPKPHVGDPTYDALQHLLNCQRLRADPLGLVRRMADLLGLDDERLRLWLFARCVQESPDWPELCDVARRVAP